MFNVEKLTARSSLIVSIKLLYEQFYSLSLVTCGLRTSIVSFLVPVYEFTQTSSFSINFLADIHITVLSHNWLIS
jgi:hypothetical protein